MDHITREHKNYKQTFLAKPSYWCCVQEDGRAWKKIHGWMKAFRRGLEPFSSVEISLIQNHMKRKQISTETICKYMLKISEIVEKKIEEMLKVHFALVFDGWTNISKYYVSVYVSFFAYNYEGYEQVVFIFLTFKNKRFTRRSSTYRTWIPSSTATTSHGWNLFALIDENCSVYKSLATSLLLSIFGFAIHRFNLEAKDKRWKLSDLLDMVHTMIWKLRYGLVPAFILILTPLCLIYRIETQWTSS